MVGIAQYFGLLGVAFSPLPILLQLFRERVGILHAFHVTARTRVTVPVPGAAHAIARLKNPRRQPKLAQLVQHVQPGKTGANDDGIEVHVSCFV